MVPRRLTGGSAAHLSSSRVDVAQASKQAKYPSIQAASRASLITWMAPIVEMRPLGEIEKCAPLQPHAKPWSGHPSYARQTGPQKEADCMGEKPVSRSALPARR